MRVNTPIVAAVCVALLAVAGSAAAQDEPRPDDPPRIQLVTPPEPTRPAALMPLYLGGIALQAYDGYSTVHGVGIGARETNPLVGGLAERPVAFWAIKAATTAMSVYLTEQLWKQGHRKQAIVWMIAADGVMAAVAVRNARLVNSIH